MRTQAELLVAEYEDRGRTSAANRVACVPNVREQLQAALTAESREICMRQRTLLLAAALGAFALTSCATASPPMSDPHPPQPQGCDAEAAKPAALGQPATAEVVERARIDAGAQIARVLKPGQMVTMEYREGRLNIDVDAANVIVNLRCG